MNLSNQKKLLALAASVLCVGGGATALLGGQAQAGSADPAAIAKENPAVNALGSDAHAVTLSSDARAQIASIPWDIDTSTAYELPAPSNATSSTWRVFVGGTATCFDFGAGADGAYTCTSETSAFAKQPAYLLRVSPEGARFIQGFAPDGIASVQLIGQDGKTLTQSSIAHNTFQLNIPKDAGDFQVRFANADGSAVR